MHTPINVLLKVPIRMYPASYTFSSVYCVSIYILLLSAHRFARHTASLLPLRNFYIFWKYITAKASGMILPLRNFVKSFKILPLRLRLLLRLYNLYILDGFIWVESRRIPSTQFIYLFIYSFRAAAAQRHAPLCHTLYFMFSFLFSFPWIPNCTRKVIGGELQERLIPVPYSKTSTDQAVRFIFMRGQPVSITVLFCFFFLDYIYVNIFRLFNNVLILYPVYLYLQFICSICYIPLACVVVLTVHFYTYILHFLNAYLLFTLQES